MSAIPSYTVVCDGPGCRSDTPNADLGNRTATEARTEARWQGWSTGQPGGKDYCPDCAGNGVMRAANARQRARLAAR